MSVRHSEIFRAIRREHDAVVTALKQAQASKKRGSPGVPAYAFELESALATAGDAYALLLIAAGEASFSLFQRWRVSSPGS